MHTVTSSAEVNKYTVYMHVYSYTKATDDSYKAAITKVKQDTQIRATKVLAENGKR